MSNLAVPIIAPWASEFTKYPIQIYPLTGTALDHREITSPAGLWWRPLWIIARYQTSSTAGSRILELQVTPGNDQPKYLQPCALNLAASSFATIIYGPQLTAYTQSSVQLFSVSVSSLPDTLWPPLTEFRLESNNAQTGDAWFSPTAIAVEIYDEDYNPASSVPLTPTPLLV